MHKSCRSIPVLILIFNFLCWPTFALGALPCETQFQSAIEEKRVKIAAIDPYDDLWRVTFDNNRVYYIHMGPRGFRRELLKEWKRGAFVTLRACEKLDMACVITGKNHADQSIAFLHKNEAISETIHNIQFIGERCSGTFFFQTLLRDNLQAIRVRNKYFMWHFPSWDMAQKLSKEPHTLFVMTVRHIENWLSSFHRKPHFTKGTQGKSFSEFIRMRWNVGGKDRGPGDIIFDNVIQMRSARTKNYFSIKPKVDHFYFMNYEVVSKYPELVLAQIASKYNLRCVPLYRPVASYQGKRKKPFKAVCYKTISEEDKAYIWRKADRALESALGY